MKRARRRRNPLIGSSKGALFFQSPGAGGAEPACERREQRDAGEPLGPEREIAHARGVSAREHSHRAELAHREPERLRERFEAQRLSRRSTTTSLGERKTTRRVSASFRCVRMKSRK